MDTDRVIYSCRLCEEPVGTGPRAFCIACEPLVENVKDPMVKRILDTLMVKVSVLRTQLEVARSARQEV